MITRDEIEAVLKDVAYKDWEFTLGRRDDPLYLQVQFVGPDQAAWEGRTPTRQYARKSSAVARERRLVTCTDRPFLADVPVAIGTLTCALARPLPIGRCFETSRDVSGRPLETGAPRGECLRAMSPVYRKPAVVSSNVSFFQHPRTAIPPSPEGDSPLAGFLWLLSPFMTPGEVVRTALLAVLTAEEHEARERFRFRGKAVFGPHLDVEALREVAGREERRGGPP